MKLLSRKVSYVKPEIPSNPEEIVSCAACDLYARPIHVRTLYLFGESSPGANANASQELKKGLQKVLSIFYPNAGRVRYNADGKLEVVCSDAGVEFIEASVDGTIDDFGSFQPNAIWDKLLVPKPDYSLPVEQVPVHYLQVTTFKCGGFSVGQALHHTVADGVSAHHFILSWCKAVKGEPIFLKPVFDHSMLNSGGAPQPASQPVELRLKPKVSPAFSGAPRKTKNRVFTFTPDQVQKIKGDAGAGTDVVFTTFESLSAHTWRGILRAKGLEASEEVRFFTTLDARSRLDNPKLPEGYYGNAIVFTSSTSTAGEVLSKPLSFAASLVRAAVTKMTNSYMRQVLAWAEAQQSEILVSINTNGNDVSSGGWIRMPFYEADFGYGKPLFSGPADNPYNGCVLLLPSHIGGGAVNVFLNLWTEHMEKLETDLDFLMHKVVQP